MKSTLPEDLPTYFADAEACFDESDFVIFGVSSDETSSFRSGARFGPDDIRKASWNFEPYNRMTDVNIKDCAIHDYGNILIENNESTKHIFDKVKQFSQQVIHADKIPLLLGGEHTFSAACVQAFEKDIYAIVFDAHLDFRDSYNNQRYNHACTIRRINDHLLGNHIFILGNRSGSKTEYEEAEKAGVTVFSSEEIHQKGIKKIIDEINHRINHKSVYLSIDIDVLDPCYAPGSGTLEPFGLNPFDLLYTIDLFSSKMTGFDIMEVAPSYDTGQTAILAAKLFRYTIEKIYIQDKQNLLK